MQQKKLNDWIWKWHIIAGLCSLPFVFVLSITGAIYLFKNDFNDYYYKSIKRVATSKELSAAPYSEQLRAAKLFTSKPISKIYLPNTKNQATGFQLVDKGRSGEVVYVNPYTAEVMGSVQYKNSLMHKVRKLHGELLSGKIGAYIVELVASWCIVLIITGVYVWWPKNKFSLLAFFTIRANKGKRILMRDIHAVIGVWTSVFLLIILAGGMPWTEVFGAQLKWVQEKTGTGYPANWHLTKAIQPNLSTDNKPISVDAMVQYALSQELSGEVTVALPQNSSRVFTVSNRAFWLSQQKVMHFNAYTGAKVHSYDWRDVGILMDLRQVAMRLHQGEYGLLNWFIVLVVSLLFALSAMAGLLSYILRKPKGRWGLPVTPKQFKIGKVVLAAIFLLAIVFPLFGASLIIVSAYRYFSERRASA